VASKLPGHGINDPSFLQPDRPMSAIGGWPPNRPISHPAAVPGTPDAGAGRL